MTMTIMMKMITMAAAPSCRSLSTARFSSSSSLRLLFRNSCSSRTTRVVVNCFFGLNKGGVERRRNHHLNQYQRREFHWTPAVTSSNKKTSVTSKDTRLAGRLRFYKDVGVIEVSPPWEEEIVHEQKLEEGEVDNGVVESPISAGVDGSDSASGVKHFPSSSSSNINGDSSNTNSVKDDLEWMLTPRLPGTTATLSSSNSKWYGITLDGRIMKTPLGQKLAVPSQKLAYGIASEWDAQIKYIQPTNMPLMTLACTALDQAAYHPFVYQEQALKFLPTDGTCYWSDPMEDRVLYRRQEQAWAELHNFVQRRFDDNAPARAIGLNEGMLMSRIRRESGKVTAGLPHPKSLVDRATNWTTTLDAWNLVAFNSICSQAKSFFVAYALLEQDSPLYDDMTKATEASRVEEEFQISNWGLVEGGHDYDRLNCSIQLASAKIFSSTIAIDNKLY